MTISEENLEDPQLRAASELVALKRQSPDGTLTAEQYYTAAFTACAMPALENGYAVNHTMGYFERGYEAKVAEKRGKTLPQPPSAADMRAFLGSYIRKDFSSLNVDPAPLAYQGVPEILVTQIEDYDSGYRAVLAKKIRFSRNRNVILASHQISKFQ